MTIKVERILSSDLFSENNSLMLDKNIAQNYTTHIPNISAITYLAKSDVIINNIYELDHAAAFVAIDFAFTQLVSNGYEIWLFIANGPWQISNRITAYKKLWKSRPKAWCVYNFQIMSNEVIFENGKKIRYAGTLKVERDDFFRAVQIVREDDACALFATKKNPTETWYIEELFKGAFPKVNSTHIDWLSFSLSSSLRNDVVIRIAGSVDEKESGIDFIFPAEVFVELIHDIK